ncbi:carbamoyltransferase [Luminiphilus sp.]|nr:carbamoyltransferase [Luminiphilus sp.]
MFTLGISAFYHDSAAALVQDGRVVAAAQEERFSRRKHDAGFPHNAIDYCLAESEISPAELTNVVFYEKPFLKFDRLLETYLAFAPRGFASFSASLPIWLKEKLFQKNLLCKQLADSLGEEYDWKTRLLFSEHHLSHAASAFYPSPFDDAAVLTMDGVGEWATTSVSVGEGSRLEMISEIVFPHSLGLLYSAFTYFAGFKVNSGEYKLMGLAPYGNPRYANLIREQLIEIALDGSFRLNMDYFDYPTGLRMTNTRFANLFGGPERTPESPITQREMDLAASIQEVTEEIVINLATSAREQTGKKNLCLAGGVALNCVANGALKRRQIFDDIWIQPAAGDAGGAIGAALVGQHLHHSIPRAVSSRSDAMSGSYLGPSFSDEQICNKLDAIGAQYQQMEEGDLLERVVEGLVAGEAVGWMQGRMEFGPRALGNRSILADPRSPEMQKQLNLKIKFRESFRPFAPSVLADEARRWFDLDGVSPYMLLVANVHEQHRLVEADTGHLEGLPLLNTPRSNIPAVTHVDFSSRVQTVHEDTNPRYKALITRFFERTGVPMLVNTSFNIRGEPIVCTPEDAYRCFMGTDLDTLVVGRQLLLKEHQPAAQRRDYRQDYGDD